MGASLPQRGQVAGSAWAGSGVKAGDLPPCVARFGTRASMRMSFFGFGASALVVAACGGGPEPRLVDTLPNDADGGSGGASSVLGSATVATDGGGIFRESGCTA